MEDVYLLLETQRMMLDGHEPENPWVLTHMLTTWAIWAKQKIPGVKFMFLKKIKNMWYIGSAFLPYIRDAV
jgi:hypothetical protein